MSEAATVGEEGDDEAGPASIFAEVLMRREFPIEGEIINTCAAAPLQLLTWLGSFAT